MADSKISALPASTTPLAGTEVLPIVQSSATKQVTVANLTAGRAISATQLTLTTGSVIVARGQGIDFSATTGTAGVVSELLNDYEEGTWTPSNFYITLTINQTARYVKIGTLVYASFDVTFPSSANGNTAEIRGLPFNNGPGASQSGVITWSDYGSQIYIQNDFSTVTQLYTNLGITLTNNMLGNKRLAGVMIYNTYPI